VPVQKQNGVWEQPLAGKKKTKPQTDRLPAIKKNDIK
jgi:hypothetical protein